MDLDGDDDFFGGLARDQWLRHQQVENQAKRLRLRELKFTDEQLAIYDARMVCIQVRLDAYLRRKRGH